MSYYTASPTADAERYYDNLEREHEIAEAKTAKAVEEITYAFATQTPVPFVKHTAYSAKVQYEPFKDAVMGLIDEDSVMDALFELLKSDTPEVKKFIAACTNAHISMWADEVGGVL